MARDPQPVEHDQIYPPSLQRHLRGLGGREIDRLDRDARGSIEAVRTDDVEFPCDRAEAQRADTDRRPHRCPRRRNQRRPGGRDQD